MRFYRGELLWVLRRWKDAAEQYTRGRRVAAGRQVPREAAYAAVLAWKNALVAATRRAPAGAGTRGATGWARARRAASAAPRTDSRQPAEDDRRVPHLREAGARRARAARDALSRGVHLLRPRPARSRRAAVPRGGAEVSRSTSWRSISANLFLDALNMECKSKEVLAWARKFLDMPELVRDAEFAQQMISLISDGYDREGTRPREARRREGMRPVVPGRRRGAADARQARRAAVERGPVLSERAPGRAGGQGVGRADQGAPGSTSSAKRALYRIGAGYQQLAFYERAAENYEAFAKQLPGRAAGADRRWATPPCSARGCSSRARRSPTWTRTSSSTARATRRMRRACSSRRRRSTRRRTAATICARTCAATSTGGASSGGLDRQVQAHFRLGELAWKASCARASDDGACLHVERMTPTRSRQVIEAANRRLGTEQAHPVRAGDQVEDRPLRPEPPAGVGRRGALPRRDRAVEGGRRGEPDRRAATPRRAARWRGVRGGGRGLLPGREGLRGSAAREVSRRASTSREPTRVRQPAAAGRGREEAGGFEEALRRLPRREVAPARADAPALPGGVQAAPGAVDDRRRRARRSASPGLRRPALHRGDPQGPARDRSVGQSPARSLLRARWRTRPRRSRRRRSRAFAPA